MELFKPHLSNIKIPSANDRVYKDECVFSFDNPETETGLYVSLTDFIGVGWDYLDKYFKKTGQAIYLHIKRERHEIPSTQQGDGPEKKITRLAIGVDGGFDPDANRKKYEYETFYSVVLVPSFSTFVFPNPDLPEIVKLSVQAIIDAPSVNKLAELQTVQGTWDGEAVSVSQYADNLEQLDNGKKIPPTGWQCEKCDKTDNLWLNLTDGSILCGRKYFDGSGGNNHAAEQYETTGYPLAVKLGTITKDGKADVFSYKENDMVEDPKLIPHLAHWGINILNMEKTEKSMIELELELNQRTNEWTALQESDGKLTPIYGAGYTGMTNMGNTCYLNSVMQMIFSIPDFIATYYDEFNTFFDRYNGNPADDFNVQMSKLAIGLLCGKYSNPDTPVDSNLNGITPNMFKLLVGRGHPELSTNKQQDVQEFLLHLFTLFERNLNNRPNPTNCFKYQIEEKYQCTSSKKVKYLTRSDLILPLGIPLGATINKDEVSAYEAKKLESEKNHTKLDPNSIVRPKIKFFSCLELFTQSELINNFYSTAVNQSVTARKTIRLGSFPDYLIIQLKKFMLREDWVPIKLDVSVEMPDELDMLSLRGSGPQPDEELLPEIENNKPPPTPVFDPEVLAQLAEMGFPPESCKRAVFFTRNSGLQAATAWIMEHITDSDFSDPFIPPGTENIQFTPNSESLAMILSMGFTQQQAVKALKATDNNVERAMEWIFSHQTELEEASGKSPQPPEFRDGNSKYRLVAFISHMGTSAMVGHYVVHIFKEGRWVIYNDNHVALSANPPKDLGYIYLYERI